MRDLQWVPIPVCGFQWMQGFIPPCLSIVFKLSQKDSCPWPLASRRFFLQKISADLGWSGLSALQTLKPLVFSVFAKATPLPRHLLLSFSLQPSAYFLRYLSRFHEKELITVYRMDGEFSDSHSPKDA